MSLLTDYGLKLIENGYLICPLCTGYKYPKGLKDWPNCPQNSNAIKEWDAAGFTGVGVQCVGLLALDVDVPTVKIGNSVLNIIKKYITNNVVLIRVGNAPKYLVVFRMQTKWSKKSTPVFWGKNGKHQVEFLANGQQFCAFHLHPETLKPYKWNALSILDYKIDELPVITEDQVEKMKDEISGVFRKAGLREEAAKPALTLVPETRAEQVLDNYTAPLDLSPERISETLQAIPQHRVDSYQDWVLSGMALYHQFKGDPVGLGYWELLSMRSHKYQEGDCSKRWASFNRESYEKQTSFKTLLDWAKESPEVLQNSDHLTLRLTDFMKLKFPKKPMFIAPAFGPGTLTLLYGPPGSGKSYLAYDLLRALHTGTSWLGWDIDPEVTPRSMIVDGEMPPDLLQQRMNDIFHDMSYPTDCHIMSKQHFLDHTPEGVFNLALESTRQYIMDKVVADGINVLIIDNKASLVQGIDENSVAENSEIIQWLIRLRSIGIMEFTIHHTGKGGQQRGTTGYEDPMDNILKFAKSPSGGEARVLTWDKDRRGRPDNCDEVIMLDMSPMGELPVTFTVVDVTVNSEINRVIEDVAGFPKDSATKRGARLNMSPSTIRRRLDEAVTNKYLKKEQISPQIIKYTLTTTGKAYLVEGRDFDDSLLE